MSDSDAPATTESDAETAFSLLADETRLAILRALEESPHEPVTFSELRERVGVSDSGRFNYHLGKLTDRFVQKTDAGYELRLAGWMVVGAILAGAYTRGEDVGPIPLDPPCLYCDGTVEWSYTDERAIVRCRDCDHRYSEAGVPPGVFEGYDDEELPAVADRYLRSLVSQVRDGFCVSCRGRVEPRLALNDDGATPGDTCDDSQVHYDCTRCHEEVAVGVGMALLDHPAVVSFFYDHGVDLSRPFLWATDWRDQPTVTLVSADPFRVRADFVADGDTLSVVVDETLSVHGIERSASE